MALTVDKLLSDARLLISRLKDQDTNTDSIMSTSQILHKRIEAMKQYQDDITELNEMAKHRPRSTLVMGIAQENRQIRELQQEKQELQMALEEHQSALQLIMHKYRQHTVHLLHANHLDSTIAQQQLKSKEEVCQLMDKMEEMATVMQQAVRMDDEGANKMQEHIARLEIENRTLRQLLEICTTANHPILAHSTQDLDPNSSLDNSYCSQQSQIEVKTAAAENRPGGQDKPGDKNDPGSQDSPGGENKAESQDTHREADKSLGRSEPGGQEDAESQSKPGSENELGCEDKSVGQSKAGGHQNNLKSQDKSGSPDKAEGKDSPGDGGKS